MIFHHHKPARSADRVAFSLIEILVTVALLSVIILGLVAMFDQTRRAFTSSFTQTDVLESGRSTAGLIAREMEQMAPSGVSNGVNFYVETPQATNNFVFVQAMIDPNEFKTNFIQQVYFLTRNKNQYYTAIGYKVFELEPNSTLGWRTGLGSLYRFSSTNIYITNLSVLVGTNAIPAAGTNLFSRFFLDSSAIASVPTPGVATNTFTHLVDGVVDFQIHAYDANGSLYTYQTLSNTYKVTFPPTNGPTIYTNVYNYKFMSNSVPAYVEVELGVLEDRSLAHYRALANIALQQAYLSNHLGQVHIFRQRIPIHNVIPSPLAYQ